MFIVYSPFQYHITNCTFLTWMFFTSLWRTIKNSSWAGSRWEDKLQMIITKWKRNKNLKLPSFCSVFKCSNHADREKDLTLLKVRREKGLTQIFRKYVTDRKLERTKTRIKLFLASPLSVSSHKVHYIRFENQKRILS